jgi:hypothetical protein
MVPRCGTRLCYTGANVMCGTHVFVGMRALAASCHHEWQERV